VQVFQRDIVLTTLKSFWKLGGATKVISNSTRRLTTNSFDSMSRKLQSGTRKVLVIRAVASGGVATSASDAALRNDVFVDSVNLRRQVLDCSRGQLILQPAVAPLVGSDGVYTVNIPTTIVPGSSYFSVLIAMITKATIDLGPLNNIANYVMFCLPPGTTPSGWISLAFVNSWLSAFNNDWCRSPSAQLRNFGKLPLQVQFQPLLTIFARVQHKLWILLW
jgi:hypothetical protein